MAERQLNGVAYATSFHKRPAPLFEAVERHPVCPVCGFVSYSRAGIHPQCASQQLDAERMKAVSIARNAQQETAAEIPPLKAWHKRCPRCQNQVNVHRPACTCGHHFNNSE